MRNERPDLRGDRLEFMKLDLSSFAATKRFADDFKKKHKSLHILVNNAGIAYVPLGEQCCDMSHSQSSGSGLGMRLVHCRLAFFTAEKTDDGYEKHFQVTIT